jgi:hypothetical protein
VTFKITIRRVIDQIIILEVIYFFNGYVYRNYSNIVGPHVLTLSWQYRKRNTWLLAISGPSEGGTDICPKPHGTLRYICIYIFSGDAVKQRRSNSWRYLSFSPPPNKAKRQKSTRGLKRSKEPKPETTPNTAPFHRLLFFLTAETPIAKPNLVRPQCLLESLVCAVVFAIGEALSGFCVPWVSDHSWLVVNFWILGFYNFLQWNNRFFFFF